MDLINNAVTGRQFPQIPFMTESRFDSFLRDRGFRLGSRGIGHLVDAGLIERLHATEGDFHPFQIWPISRLFEAVNIRLDSGISYNGLDPAAMKRFIDLNWSRCQNHLTDFPQSPLCVEFNQKVLPFLLWLESYFLPVVRGPRPGVVHVTGLNASEWRRWDARALGPDLLGAHSMTMEQLSGWRSRILLDASNCDPALGLYLLLRSMPFDQRDRFRGRLRLAYDLYEVSELIRLFLEETSGQPLVKEWDPNGNPDTPWVERIYGSQPRFGEPGFLRPVVRHFGIDPAFRVRWLVEGQTEAGFILRYVERLGANVEQFVTIREFGGDGAFQRESPAIDADLEAAKEEQCFVTLTFDESSRTRRRLKGLIEAGRVNFPFVLNKPEFELGNFTVEQLVDVALTWASELEYSVGLTQGELARDVKRRISQQNADFKRAFNSVIRLNGDSFKLSKGSQWGQRLADYLSDIRDLEAKAGTYSDQTLAKIERQILFVLHNSQPFIDYRLSIENLDPASLEIV